MADLNKYYDIIENKATKTAEILIYGEIGDSFWQETITARQFVTDFRNLEKNNDRINIRVNSPGGSVWDGQAIFNVISTSLKEIHTYNDGLCASMAAVLLLAAKPENVHAAKNSLLMLHSPMTGARGNRKDIENVLAVLDKVQESLVTSLCEKTGLNKDDVTARYFDYTDHWFTADEAKAEGLYVNVDDYEAENVPQNAASLKFADLVKQFEPSNTTFANWIGRIAPESKIIPVTEDTLIFIDMDINKIRAAYNLTEDKYPTEEDVLNYVHAREQELADSIAARETAESNLETANNTIAERDTTIVGLNARITVLEAGPGAITATAITDGDEGADEPVSDFRSAFAEAIKFKNK
jgi:ATP-dependent Clp endopeptidase proteolytic subunit ClpP